jgi:hypothetical protein
MRMEMLNAIPSSPTRKNRRFGEISDVQRNAAVGSPADAERCAQRREKSEGASEKEMEDAPCEDQGARSDDEIRPFFLENVLRIDE